MGGTTFDHYAAGADVATAFRAARDEAAYEHGHGGYSGTIAEKPDYVIITNTPLLEVEANGLIDRLIDNDDPRIRDKWGPAGAIPVIKSTRTVSVKDFDYLHDNEFREYGKVQPALLEAVAAKVKLKKGETIQSVSLTGYSEPNRQRRSSYYGYGHGAPRSTSRTGCSAQVTINKPPATRVAPIVIEIPADLENIFAAHVKHMEEFHPDKFDVFTPVTQEEVDEVFGIKRTCKGCGDPLACGARATAASGSAPDAPPDSTTCSIQSAKVSNIRLVPTTRGPRRLA